MAPPVRSSPVKKKSNMSPAPKNMGNSAGTSLGKSGKAKPSEELPVTKSPSVSTSEIPDSIKFFDVFLQKKVILLVRP